MKLVKTINLIKYDNRKLYSPTGELLDKGGYITLKDVRETLRNGNKVLIRRKKDGADVTNEVLKEVLANTMELSTDKLISLIRG